MKKTNTIAFSNLIISLIFIVGGIWAWIQVSSLQEIANTYVQPSTFPKIMIVGLEIFSVILLIQSVFKLMTMKEDDWLAAPTGSLNVVKNKGVQGALAVILLCIFFAAAFKTLGYIVCSIIVSLIIMYMIGKRNWVQMLLISVLIPLGMWFIFYKILTVNIPLGPLNFLRDIVDKIKF